MPMRCEEPPCVSVIMGTLYRHPKLDLLKRSVDSILAQTYTDFEFLICDDGSTEEAKTYLEKIGAQDDRVRLVRREDCLDLAKKLNLCLRETHSKIIARMDDDDRSYPNRLEKQIRFLTEHKDISFVGCNVSLVKDGQPIGIRELPCRPKVEDFYLVQPYIHPALMFRREALDAVGGYSENRDCILCEDYDLLLRIYKAGMQGANIQEILLDYTVSDGKIRKMRHRMNEAKTRHRMFKELGKLPMAWPYVVKPIAVGLMPTPIRERWRARGWDHAGY